MSLSPLSGRTGKWRRRLRGRGEETDKRYRRHPLPVASVVALYRIYDLQGLWIKIMPIICGNGHRAQSSRMHMILRNAEAKNESRNHCRHTAAGFIFHLLFLSFYGSIVRFVTQRRKCGPTYRDQAFRKNNFDLIPLLRPPYERCSLGANNNELL